MSEIQRPSLVELTEKLSRDIGKTISIELTEKSLKMLKKSISSPAVDVKNLTYWVSSIAHILGKDLSSEAIQSPGSTTVRDAMKMISHITRELARNTEILEQMARHAGTTVDAFLSDSSNEAGQQIAMAREDQVQVLNELKGSLSEFGVSLVHILQENLHTKKQMTDEELVDWEIKFSAVEAMPEDYEAYTASLEEIFVLRMVEIFSNESMSDAVGLARERKARRYMRTELVKQNELKKKHSSHRISDNDLYDLEERLKNNEKKFGYAERKLALAETVWRRFFEKAKNIVAKHYPDDEAMQRSILEAIVATDTFVVKVTARKKDGEVIGLEEFIFTINGDKLKHLDKQSICVLGEAYLKSYTLARLSADLNVERNRNKDASSLNKDVFEHVLAILPTLRDGTHPPQYQRESDQQINPLSDISFVNEIQASLQFLFDALSSEYRYEPYERLFSPFGLRYDEGFDTLASVKNGEVSANQDGIFYETTGEAKSEHTAKKETERVRDFQNGLSLIYNKQLSEEVRTPITPEEYRAHVNERILIAEQAALEAKMLKEVVKEGDSKLSGVTAELRIAQERLVHQEKVALQESEKASIEIDSLKMQLSAIQRATELQSTDIQTLQKNLKIMLRDLTVASYKPGLFGGNIKNAIQSTIDSLEKLLGKK